jgi:hypothetical protein
MTHKHLYLFALEVDPLDVGGIYNELPLHCTLMHRFWSELNPDELTDRVRPLFEKSQSQLLSAYERLALGPKKLIVSEVELTGALRTFHMGLYELLNGLGVEYTAAEWVGKGYRAHVTERETTRLEVGKQHLSKAAYLIEVEVPGYEHKRIIRAKFGLNG